MNQIPTLIIDDELHARENLKDLIAKFCPKLQVVGTAQGKNDGLDKIEHLKPKVVFLDIMMPSGSEGFDLLEAIPERNFFVVFVTAFKDFAIKAFQANAINYLLKPVNIDELITAVNHVCSLVQQPGQYNYDKILSNLSDSLQRNQINRFTIRHSRGMKIVDDMDIVSISADGNCCKLQFIDGSGYLDTRTLKVYEEFLDPNKFFRLHKSHLINLKYLSGYSTENGHFVIMRSGSELPISRSRLRLFINRLKTI